MRPSSATVCYLGLGSNLSNDLGSPTQHIQNAIQQLQQNPNIFSVKASSLYQSTPMGVLDQPDFINAVAEIHTDLSAWQLLTLCQTLEQNAKRQRLRHWGERSLDVDILLYGDQHIQSPELTIPHLGLLQRNFVVIPLLELNPTLHVQQQSLAKLTIAQDWQGLSKLTDGKPLF